MVPSTPEYARSFRSCLGRTLTEQRLGTSHRIKARPDTPGLGRRLEDRDSRVVNLNVVVRKLRTRTSLVIIVAMSIVATLLVTVAPAPSVPTTLPRVDPEGGSESLHKALEQASRGYTEAKAKLDFSKKKYDQLSADLVTLEDKAAHSKNDLRKVAAEAYKQGGPNLQFIGSMLSTSTFQDFLQKLTYVDHLAGMDATRINRAARDRKNISDQQEKLKQEIKEQAEQEKAMAKQKADAERALGRFGGGIVDGPGGSANAQPAPRNANGTWPRESCSQDDPTTSGCLTARTLHAYNQARSNGYTRYTRCYRVQASGEHGKGRACDFSSATGGFEGAATGGDKVYGDQLAGWFVANSDRLGVLYVIWYRRIWLPGTGWRSYSGGGSPSAAHTNHVHLSMQ